MNNSDNHSLLAFSSLNFAWALFLGNLVCLYATPLTTVNFQDGEFNLRAKIDQEQDC